MKRSTVNEYVKLTSLYLNLISHFPYTRLSKKCITKRTTQFEHFDFVFGEYKAHLLVNLAVILPVTASSIYNCIYNIFT